MGEPVCPIARPWEVEYDLKGPSFNPLLPLSPIFSVPDVVVTLDNNR